jgi:hypothetical protein
MWMVVFWLVMSCSPENGGSMFLWNIGTHTASQARRPPLTINYKHITKTKKLQNEL